MKNPEDFSREIVKSHDCEKCHNKIICIEINRFGETCCAYCKQPVRYPKPTKEEIEGWMERIKNEKTSN